MIKLINNQLLYVAGSGRSGSTLLDMLLSRHSSIASLGEVHRLYMNLRIDTDAHRCTCGERVSNCEFWKAVEDSLFDLYPERCVNGLRDLMTTDPKYLNIPDDNTGLNIQEPVPTNIYKVGLSSLLLVLGSKRLFDLFAIFFSSVSLKNRIAQDSHLLYDAVRHAIGKPIVVDSTKTPLRLKSLYMSRPENFKVLHLVRDGRAVAFARVGRQGIDMSQAARIWKSEQRKLKAILLTVPKSKVIRVHYESLCMNTEEELRRVCEFLNINFEPGMMRFDKAATHGLGGNPMRWRRDETEIVLNDRWRDEISCSQLNTFERIAGNLNRMLGYDL